MKTVDIEKFTKLVVRIKYDKVIEKASEGAVKELKGKNIMFKRHRRKGNNYSDGWKAFIYKNDGETEAVVWNRTNWQLTWLLENGHLIVNKRGGVGWSAPRKHIKPAYDKVEGNFKRLLNDVEIDVDFN